MPKGKKGFQKGVKHSKAHRARLSKALTGRKLSETTKKKMSEAKKKEWRSGKRKYSPNSGYQKGHPQFNTGRTHWKKGHIPSNWKGEEVGYVGLHLWVKSKKGKPKICEHCGITYKHKRLAWANIDHQYRRTLDDFISLCYSCHKNYDIKNN